MRAVSLKGVEIPPKINKNICPHKNFHIGVHSSVTSNSKKLYYYRLKFYGGFHIIVGDIYCTVHGGKEG